MCASFWLRDSPGEAVLAVVDAAGSAITAAVGDFTSLTQTIQLRVASQQNRVAPH